MTRTTPRGWGRAWHAAPALLLAIALTGCLKVDMALTIEGETVSGSIIGAIDAEAADIFGMTAEDVFPDPEDEDGDDFANVEGVTAETYEQDGWVGTEYRLRHASLAELNELAGDDEEFPRINYDAEQGTYEFLLTLDLRDWFVDDLSEEERAELPGLDPEALTERFESQISVTFPGSVTEHNGELDGTTVTWHPQPGEHAEMRAVAQASGDGAAPDGPAVGPGSGQGAGPGVPGSGSSATSTGTALLVALGVLVIAGGALTGWLLLRRRSPAAATGTDTDDSQPPGG